MLGAFAASWTSGACNRGFIQKIKGKLLRRRHPFIVWSGIVTVNLSAPAAIRVRDQTTIRTPARIDVTEKVQATIPAAIKHNFSFTLRMIDIRKIITRIFRITPILRITKKFKLEKERLVLNAEAARRRKLLNALYPEGEGIPEPEHPPGYDPEPGEAEEDDERDGEWDE